MIKKKAAGVGDSSGIAATEDSGTKTTPIRRTRKKKKIDAVQVHEQIAGIVKASAAEIAQALIERALNGDASAAKYLFEFAHIFPTADETSAEAEEEDSLAKTLMHRLNLPEEPIRMDEDDDGKTGINEASSGDASRSELMQDQKTTG